MGNDATLMFAGKARSLLSKGEHEKCSSRVGSGLSYEHDTRLDRPARSLYYKTFYGRNLWIFIIS
jgi:hypothetical protein